MNEHKTTKRKIALSVLSAIALGSNVRAAVPTQQSEGRVKAAFLYNFTKYVEWPSSAFDGSTLVIGIVGEDSLGGALDDVANGKTVGGRTIVVRHYRWGQDLTGCQELFVPADEMEHAGLLSHIRNKPILIVGESSGFARRYGEINFVLEGNRVRFEINGGAANECGLSISSKLLSLGKSPS